MIKTRFSAWAVPVPDLVEVGGERAVDRGVVHGVVVAGFARGIHDLGFQPALEHVRTVSV